MIRFALGMAVRFTTRRGRSDIAIMLEAGDYAGKTDRTLQGYPDGYIVDRPECRIVVDRSPKFGVGRFGLQVFTPDGSRAIGTVLRDRPAELWHDKPTHRLVWA